MSNVQTPGGKVGKAPVKNDKNNATSPQKVKSIYCILCRRSYLKNEAHVHMHGMLHHRELDLVLGKNSLLHDCQACKESSMALNEYAQHISTAQHIAKLKSLMSKNVKPFPLTKYLGAEAISRILKRNKTLKSKEKKAMKKKKKKLKQLAGPKGSKMPPEAASKNVVKSKVIKLEQNRKDKSNSVVVQNKENKVSSLQRIPHYRESTLQNQSGKSAHFSGEPAGRTWHHTSVRAQFNQSAHQLRYEDRLVQRPHSTQIVATNMPYHIRWPAVNQYDHYDKQCGGAADFTSDHFPQSGAIIFGQNENAEQEGSHCSAQPVSAGSSAKTAPIRDIDVSTMLRQIRRALGVREPCRADREARRQNSEAVGPDGGQPACSSIRNEAKEAAPRSGVCPPSVAQTEPKQTVKVTQATAKQSPVVSSDSNGPSNVRVRESQGAFDNQTSLSRFSDRTSSSEQNPDVAHKSQTALQPSKVQGEKESPTLNLSGAKSKLNWREEGRRKKQESEKVTPRFGIEFGNQQSDQNSSTQAEDLPLSEGFHWESIPDCPSSPHRTKLPPAPQNTADNDSHAETQTDTQKQQPSEPRDAAQEGCSKTVSVKSERNTEDENGDSRDQNSDRKRKHKEAMYEDISDKEPQGKKKKTKSKKDQNQMDQLLAVSLREEELSQSLQDLDESLVQARNALQAAYAEVQRLLLLRQQFTAEVNSLRAKRIEILQGMQGGYLGVNNAEKAPTSSAGAAAAAAAAAAVQPRLSPLPSSSAFPTSSSQLPPPTLLAPSVSQPHPAPSALPVMSVKQEMHQPPAVSCNPDAPQVPANQPVPLFPPLLHASPRLAAPTTTVTSLKQLRTEGPTSASPSSASSARQQDGLKETVRSEEADSRSEKEITGGGNLRAAPEKPVSTSVPEREQNAADAAQRDDGGNESDDSVEMMEPSNQVVIDVDESDTEETASNAPVHQEPPQKSVSVEFSSASTQTFQQIEVERKVQPTLAPVKDASAPSECVKGVEDEEPSLGAFENHTGPVHGLQIYEGLLFTCSGDNTARAYSLKTKECQAVFKGHTNKINCLLVSSLPNLLTRLFTGSSDQTIRCYSLKSGKCLEQLSLPDRVMCLHVAWNILFAGLASGSVASYDIKTLKLLDMFECHGPRGVSCLSTAQEGARRVLLVGSYDSTISVRDAKSGLLLRSLEGHTKTVLCMKVVNDLVFSGSSDTSVHAHNIHTGELVRIYKGHGHAVTSIVILGKVMVTACLDKLVRVYELQSHDRLQVYGGHSDMVMCMAVHKSVIYTGCYDGTVQAVKLNLMKNYRCWWQNCSLIFGVAEHLVQHLVADHSNPKLQTVKCRWRGCSSFFSTQQSVRQELPEHMKIHVENDSKVQL